MLDYDFLSTTLKVYWLLPGKGLSDGLHVILSDEDTVVMKLVAHKVKKFMLYYDHYNYVATSSFADDIVMHPVSSLPKVMSPSKAGHIPKTQGERLPDFYSNIPQCSASEGHIEDVTPCDGEVSSDSDFVDSDNDIAFEDDDLFYDNVDDQVIDEGAGQGKKISKGKRLAGSSDMAEHREWDEISTDEEDLQLPDSDEEGDVSRNLSSFRPEDMCNPKLKLGMKFSTVEVLRKAIIEYSLKNRVEITMPKNDRTRVQAHCADGCPWLLYASLDNRVHCFVVKKYVGQHRCQKKWALKRCTAKWLAEKYKEKFRADEKMSLKNFAKTVQLEWNFTPSRSKLSRARAMAVKTVHGDEVEQFKKLWAYGHELRRSNPGSSLYINLNDGIFSTLYMSLDACKRGFLIGCRPVICLDGCHIKTKFGGILLTAVGIDPNDCIFPIAMAVVEVESLQTWKWFLNTLKEDLAIDNTSPWTIMTDKQKVCLLTAFSWTIQYTNPAFSNCILCILCKCRA